MTLVPVPGVIKIDLVSDEEGETRGDQVPGGLLTSGGPGVASAALPWLPALMDGGAHDPGVGRAM